MAAAAGRGECVGCTAERTKAGRSLSPASKRRGVLCATPGPGFRANVTRGRGQTPHGGTGRPSVGVPSGGGTREEVTPDVDAPWGSRPCGGAWRCASNSAARRATRRSIVSMRVSHSEMVWASAAMSSRRGAFELLAVARGNQVVVHPDADEVAREVVTVQRDCGASRRQGTPAPLCVSVRCCEALFSPRWGLRCAAVSRRHIAAKTRRRRVFPRGARERTNCGCEDSKSAQGNGRFRQSPSRVC